MSPTKKETVTKLHMDPNEPTEISCHSDQELRISSELLRGREAAYELLGIVRHLQHTLSTSAADTTGLQQPPAASELVTRILDSFSSSLSLLGCQDLAAQDLGESSSRSSSKGRKGCNKLARKRDVWTQVTSASTNDGHEWRKYGQKPILHAKYPRSYYRCTHKPHCLAKKRVQQMNDDNPPMYSITYAGHHTCTQSSSNPSSFNGIDSSVLFNFESVNIEQPNSSLDWDATLPSQYMARKQYTNQQGSTSNTFESEKMKLATSPDNSEWSFDDLDYIVGSVEFNDDHHSKS